MHLEVLSTDKSSSIKLGESLFRWERGWNGQGRNLRHQICRVQLYFSLPKLLVMSLCPYILDHMYQKSWPTNEKPLLFAKFKRSLCMWARKGADGMKEKVTSLKHRGKRKSSWNVVYALDIEKDTTYGLCWRLSQTLMENIFWSCYSKSPQTLLG